MEDEHKGGTITTDIPAAIAFLTTILICMSTIYSTFYFYIIGAEFQGFYV